MSCRNEPSNPTTGAGADTPCDETVQPCPCTTRDFSPIEVNESISETISNAPSAPTDYTAWNNTFGWRSKFTLTVERSTCKITATIKIKVTGTITAGQKSAWKSAIEAKWNNKVKLVCPDTICPGACTDGYVVAVEVLYVDSGEHYSVRANTPGATEGGRSGLGGTTSMTGWGVNDTVDITHEFGHMLGAKEEYFTTDGVDYTEGGTKRGFRDPGAGIMNNPSGDPLPRNYDLIRQKAATVMGTGASCTTEAR